MITVALDSSPEEARPYIEEAAPTHPSLIDTEHVVAELYSMINVPTVVWIDEAGHIVRPNDIEFSNDAFIDFHGKESAPHIEALRHWARSGELPEGECKPRPEQRMPTFGEQLARTEFAVAWHLHKNDRIAAAEDHFQRAAKLSPFDFTVRRASMPIRGVDPMGPDFFEMFNEWNEAGRPGYD